MRDQLEQEAAMELYRELTHDDPHRRSARGRGASPTKDEGDLFTLRPSPRKLRILIDIEAWTADHPFIDELLHGFMRYENIEVLQVRMSQVKLTDHEDSHEVGFVRVRDVTEHKGSFSYPGSCYGWSIDTERPKFDGSKTLGQRGSISPQPELFRSLAAYNSFSDEQREGITADDIERAVLLTEIARAIDYDLIISETKTTGRRDVPANDRSNVVTRADALPIIAHYMRRQQIYVINPIGRGTINRKGYYMETVAALAPGIWHWLAKCRRSALFVPSSRRFVADCESLIDRLARALRARDELIASVGALQTDDVIDDGADALDHVLVSLCGAVDVLARSLHTALQISGHERNAKLHRLDGYRKLMSFYADAANKDLLDALQKHLAVVFSLRNSIHSRTLAAIASLTVSEHGLSALSASRLDLVIPPETVDSVRDESGGGLEYWHARELGGSGHLVADLSRLLDTCFSSVLRFLDQLCRIIAAEWTLDKDPVLREDIIGADSTLSGYGRELRIFIGMPQNGDLDGASTEASETDIASGASPSR
ncbi:hypothetical protein [Rhodococcus pyridinivorans]|uniref:hypothetical protein n=1 Tax=Rhodococcus pyridinivorans TaxID=103816 RepID=UPI00110F0526|nr:hypothetical protein [Rhodococcus pyridinivorans]